MSGTETPKPPILHPYNRDIIDGPTWFVYSHGGDASDYISHRDSIERRAYLIAAVLIGVAMAMTGAATWIWTRLPA